MAKHIFEGLKTHNLLTAALIAVGWLVTSAPRTAEAAEGFRFDLVGDASLGLWEGERPVLMYHHGDIAAPEGVKAPPHSNYVHPIYGLDGEVLTDDFPADHVHHRGLHWAWPYVQVGDDKREHSLWKYEGMRYRFNQWLKKEANADAATIGVENDWVVGDRPVLREEAWLTVHRATDEGQAIDLTLKLTPEEAITLRGAEGKSYGGLVLRYAPREETTITTADGRAREDLLITKLPWADVSATFKGASKPSGAAVFVDPAHPNAPLEWMTRDYGLLAVGWPGVSKITLEPRKTVTCRYRVWLHRGMGEVDTLKQAYEAYGKSLNGGE